MHEQGSPQSDLAHSHRPAMQNTSFLAIGTDPAVLDRDVFLYLRETLPPAVLAQIYSEFLERTRLQLAKLAHADRVNLREFAHTISGTAGMLGARVFAIHAAALGSVVPASPELDHIVQLLSASCTTLEETLRREKVQL